MSELIRRSLSLLAAIVLLPGLALADAPAMIPVQGLVADADGEALDGPVQITFSLYDSEDASAVPFWTETREVTVDRGFFAVYLGDAQALDPALIAERSTLLLGVAVEDDSEMGRVRIGSAAYAMYAAKSGNAATLDGLSSQSFARSGGSCEKGSVVTGIDKNGAVVCQTDTDTKYDGSDFAKSNQPCPAGQVVKAIGPNGVLDCTPNTQVVVTGKDFASSDQACDDSQVVVGIDAQGKLKCGADANEKYSGTDFATSDQSCGDGEVVSGIDPGGNVVCGKDANTEYGGANFATSDQKCAEGQVIIGIAEDGTLNCVADSNNTYDGSDFAKSQQACPEGKVVNGVGDDGTLLCADDANDKYTGNNFAVSSQNCPDGAQVVGIKSDGTLACLTDADTKYDGNSFAVSGQQCDTGFVVGGIDLEGKVKCVADINTQYSGDKFALSNQKCNPGETVVGVDDSGNVLCEADSNTEYDGASFVMSDQNCAQDYVVAGVDDEGKVVCVKDANTTYDSGAFALSDQACASGKFAVGVSDKGVLKCEADSNTVYDGTHFATSNQDCPSGFVVAGLNASGKVKCVADIDTKYTGADFVASNQSCGAGQVVSGVSKAGVVICVDDQNTQYDGNNFAKSSQACGKGQSVKGITASGTLVCEADADSQLTEAEIETYGKKVGFVKVTELPKVAQTGQYADLIDPFFTLTEGTQATFTKDLTYLGTNGKKRASIGYLSTAPNNGQISVYSDGKLTGQMGNSALSLYDENATQRIQATARSSLGGYGTFSVYGSGGDSRIYMAGTYLRYVNKQPIADKYGLIKLYGYDEAGQKNRTTIELGSTGGGTLSALGRLNLYANDTLAHKLYSGSSYRSWKQFNKDASTAKFHLYNYDDFGAIMLAYGPNGQLNSKLTYYTSTYPNDGYFGVHNDKGKYMVRIYSDPFNAKGGKVETTNSEGKVRTRLATATGGQGYIRTYGDNSSYNVELGSYSNSDPDNGSVFVYGATSKKAVDLSAQSYGSRVALNNSTEDPRVLMHGLENYGYTYFYGPNSVNVYIGKRAGDDLGSVEVRNAKSTTRAGMYVNSSDQGIVYGTLKNFRMDHPEKADKEIWYASVEGPEAGAYVRGTATLKEGKATIQFPDHFRLVVNPKGMTIQTSPHSAQSMGLAVTSRSKSGFEVTELHGGSGSYEFDWEAKSVRAGFEDFQVVRDREPQRPEQSDASPR